VFTSDTVNGKVFWIQKEHDLQIGTASVASYLSGLQGNVHYVLMVGSAVVIPEPVTQSGDGTQLQQLCISEDTGQYRRQ
jgi:hypothetical protein